MSNVARRISAFRSNLARRISSFRSNARVMARISAFRVDASCSCGVDAAGTRSRKRSIMAMQVRRSSMLAQARRASSYSLAVMRSNRAAKARRSVGA